MNTETDLARSNLSLQVMRITKFVKTNMGLQQSECDKSSLYLPVS